ncbi:hypothetical protein [Streptomyces violascens]|uniref:hypothetical protein n=1 Tax=Streptomyces violascens TaxID=67381 RepID=UPI003652518C
MPMGGGFAGEHPRDLDRVDAEEVQIALGDGIPGMASPESSCGHHSGMSSVPARIPRIRLSIGSSEVQPVRDGEGLHPRTGIRRDGCLLSGRGGRRAVRSIAQRRGAEVDALAAVCSPAAGAVAV